MQTILIVVHLMIVLALVGVVLLQRSEGGALGVGGGSGFMTGRGQANVLTRATAILAALFFATSLSLTLLARYGHSNKSILEGVTAPKSQGNVLDQLKKLEEQRGRDGYKPPEALADPAPADTTSSGSRPPSLAPAAPTEPTGTPDKPAAESPTAPKSEAPKSEAPKSEAPKSEAPKSDAPKAEAPKPAAPEPAAPEPAAPAK